MIKMMAMLGALVADAAALPKVSGSRLEPGTTCYAIIQDGKAIGATLQSIKPTRVEGVRAWSIIVHQRLAGGRFDMRDSFLLRRSDLRPLRFESRRGSRSAPAGWHEIRLDYRRDKITGTRTTAKGVTPIEVPLPGPVWEGNLWGITFGALPLREGGRFRLPFWQYDKGFGTFVANVVGSDTVDTPSGKTAAWIVEAGADPAKLSRYLISKKNGAELGYSAGGAEQRIGGDCTGLG